MGLSQRPKRLGLERIRQSQCREKFKCTLQWCLCLGICGYSWGSLGNKKRRQGSWDVCSVDNRMFFRRRQYVLLWWRPLQGIWLHALKLGYGRERLSIYRSVWILLNRWKDRSHEHKWHKENQYFCWYPAGSLWVASHNGNFRWKRDLHAIRKWNHLERVWLSNLYWPLCHSCGLGRDRRIPVLYCEEFLGHRLGWTRLCSYWHWLALLLKPSLKWLRFRRMWNLHRFSYTHALNINLQSPSITNFLAQVKFYFFFSIIQNPQ